jgi:hypothetical protein
MGGPLQLEGVSSDIQSDRYSLFKKTYERDG